MGYYVKYPRTFHIPGSPGSTSDDKVLESLDIFKDRHVIISEKMDGENTSLHFDGHSHARSLDSKGHVSRDWVKKFWSERYYHLPQGWRICGENVYAKHSIHYDFLESYFYGFSIWDEYNRCLSWKDTVEWFDELEIVYPHIFYNGIFDENYLENLIVKLNSNKCEGFVIRLAESFQYKDFDKSVAKWVRANHVQTDEHWMNQPLVKNLLKSEVL